VEKAPGIGCVIAFVVSVMLTVLYVTSAAGTTGSRKVKSMPRRMLELSVGFSELASGWVHAGKLYWPPVRAGIGIMK
jgi:hypothetical protein